MQPYVADADFTLYVGDALDVLRQLPDRCVDCCVTSPPYWGLRDYGTGQWGGGDDGCDHVARLSTSALAESPASTRGGAKKVPEARDHYRDVCGKCGATRVDRQLGLEPTPEQYVDNMVAVFREVRRVLAAHGTCWVNLGDSYAAGQSSWAKWDRPKQQTQTERRTLVHPTKPKDLVGIPWRVAFALQADGWYLRSDIVWSKPNPMPESVTDRPTKAHEYVFLLTRQPRYWFDQEAVREPAAPSVVARSAYAVGGKKHVAERNDNGRGQERRYSDYVAGRNIRSVWEIATQPYSEAHFATFPEALVERCLKAGCPEWVCSVCGKPRGRIVEREGIVVPRGNEPHLRRDPGNTLDRDIPTHYKPKITTVGWSHCAHSTVAANLRPGRVLDPFMGSGTTALVARRLGRHAIGIELNEGYAALCARRLQQLSLLAEGTV